MIITREILMAQKTVAVAERERLVAAANARAGEIRALDQLLVFLELPDQKGKEPSGSALAKPLQGSETR